jgi:hypothetical protein
LNEPVDLSATASVGRLSPATLQTLRSRGRWTQIALVVVALVDLIAVGSDIAEYRLLGTDYTIEEADANDLRQIVVGVVQFSLFVLTAVLFIIWFKRAYDHVEHLGGNRRYGTGWAIGAWFVPILNLWRPKQIANDIWRAGDERGDSSISPWLTLWWAAFLISNWASQIAGRLSLTGDTVDELQTAAAIYAFADGVDVIAAVLAIWVVWAITRRQASRAVLPSG